MFEIIFQLLRNFSPNKKIDLVFVIDYAINLLLFPEFINI